jgi:hypothetical protein
MTLEDDSVIASSLLSTRHGRERREERKINKIDLQNARRYGMVEAGHGQRLKYTYGGIVFIYDPERNYEVTSFPSRDPISVISGTKCTRPVILDKKEEFRASSKKKLYKVERLKVLADKAHWTSHTVLVVDMSGSMRRDDVNGARCRSDGVWIALARDFVKKQLGRKTATMYDLVSVVLMNETAEAVMVCYPMHWYIYNKFVRFREWKTIRPRGPGNYLPALEKAEKLLDKNSSASCSLSLLFFSDGKPSDRGPFKERMGAIASKFGRRLTVCCIGMADDSEDFTTLQEMATEAENYGALASFNKPSLSMDSLSNIISSLVTSLASSKTEMTDLRTGKQRSVRVDIRRERKGAPDDTNINDNWRVFHDKDPDRNVPYIWTWSYKLDDFVTLMDPRCIGCYRNTADHNFDVLLGEKCPQCKASFFCRHCAEDKDRFAIPHTNYFRIHMGSAECKKCAKDRRLGKIVKWAIPSFSLAVKKLVFGEGAERIVYKVRFLDWKRDFIGPKMVAKESRFVEAHGNYDDRMNYHRDFLRTQAIASELADTFNGALDSVKGHFDQQDYSVLDRFPRIRFLKPLVVEALTGDKSGTEWNILVEEQLEGRYTKFNSNTGYVHHTAQELNHGFAGSNQDSDSEESSHEGGLEVIEEGSEEEEDSDDEVFDNKHKAPNRNALKFDVRPEHIPQTFSHFTYERSKKQLMVVDLQGVLQTKPDGNLEYVLTDPAIHKRRRKKRTNKLQNWTFGRTDRGESGMRQFFETHQCNDACRILGLTEQWRYSKRD